MKSYKQFFLEMAYPQLFSFEDFNKIHSFNGKLKYANEHLVKICSGSSRVAYKVDEEKVLKIAKNKKGLDQNRVESDWSKENYGVTAKVFNRSEDNFWIEMELAKKLTPSRFKELTGISIKELETALKYVDSQRNPRNLYHNPKPPPECIYENEFYLDMERFIVDYDLPSGDYQRLNSFGEVKRNGKDIVVLIDFGLDKDTWNTHYNKQK